MSSPQRSVTAIDKPGYMFLSKGHQVVFGEGDALVKTLQAQQCSDPAKEVRTYLESHTQAIGFRLISEYRLQLYTDAPGLDLYVLAERLEILMQETWRIRGRWIAADDQIAADILNRRPGSR